MLLTSANIGSRNILRSKISLNSGLGWMEVQGLLVKAIVPQQQDWRWKRMPLQGGRGSNKRKLTTRNRKIECLKQIEIELKRSEEEIRIECNFCEEALTTPIKANQVTVGAKKPRLDDQLIEKATTLASGQDVDLLN